MFYLTELAGCAGANGTASSPPPLRLPGRSRRHGDRHGTTEFARSSSRARPVACSRTGCRESGEAVLLLEAGPRTNLWIRAARLRQALPRRQLGHGWAEPALNSRRVFTPRGKMLGGSSSINGRSTSAGARGLRRLEDQGLGFSISLLLCSIFVESVCVARHELCDAFIDSTALGIRATTISAVRNGKAPAITTPDIQGAAAPARRRHLQSGRRSRRTDYLGQLTADRILFEGKQPSCRSMGRFTRLGKSSCPRVRSIPRSCCSSRASARARCSSATASRWCTSRRRWASTCRITSMHAPSGAAAGRSRSTTTWRHGGGRR